MTGIEVPALSIPKVVLVTGGSSGIGKATASRLAAMGSAVVVGYNSRRALAEAVVGGLQGGGHLAMRIAIDDPACIAEAVAAVDRQYGRLDALVNCGGATTPVPATDLAALTDDIFDRTVTLNLRGPFAMVRAFRPLLERGSGAAIVNISSIAARTGSALVRLERVGQRIMFAIDRRLLHDGALAYMLICLVGPAGLEPATRPL